MWTDFGLACLSLVGLVVVGWSLWGTWLSLHVLNDLPPESPRKPTNRLQQVLSRLSGSGSSYRALFVGAIVGTAVADYDRDVHRGLGEMVWLFLFGFGLLTLWWGVGLALLMHRSIKEFPDKAPRWFDGESLAWACGLAALLAFVGLSGAGVGLSDVLRR
jgi:hypothetical protein